MPTYEEILETEQDEEIVEQAEQFERAHNFRFEESDGGQLQTFPRDIDGSLRRKKDKRKEDRQRKVEHHLEQKHQKIEEIKRLKNLKKKEILDKLQRIEVISGCPLDVLRHHLYLNREFDSKEFDQHMQSIFDDTYYQSNDKEGSKKPRFDHDPFIDEPLSSSSTTVISENSPKSIKTSLSSTSIISNDSNISDNHSQSSKPKSIELLVQSINAETRQSLERDIKEYDQLGYEDILGDMPTRFKYRMVKPANYGLSIEEILMSDVKDLNRRMSLKKIAPYRSTNRKQERQIIATADKSSTSVTTTTTADHTKSIPESRLQSYQVYKKPRRKGPAS